MLSALFTYSVVIYRNNSTISISGLEAFGASLIGVFITLSWFVFLFSFSFFYWLFLNEQSRSNAKAIAKGFFLSLFLQIMTVFFFLNS